MNYSKTGSKRVRRRRQRRDPNVDNKYMELKGK